MGDRHDLTSVVTCNWGSSVETVEDTRDGRLVSPPKFQQIPYYLYNISVRQRYNAYHSLLVFRDYNFLPSAMGRSLKEGEIIEPDRCDSLPVVVPRSNDFTLKRRLKDDLGVTPTIVYRDYTVSWTERPVDPVQLLIFSEVTVTSGVLYHTLVRNLWHFVTCLYSSIIIPGGYLMIKTCLDTTYSKL